jgi:hypothetical protein
MEDKFDPNPILMNVNKLKPYSKLGGSQTKDSKLELLMIFDQTKTTHI